MLVKYAQRLDNLSQAARQALIDVKRSLRHFTVGITATVGESMVARVFAAYCGSHPATRVSIVTAPADDLYEKLLSYELDLAIVEGSVPLKRVQYLAGHSDPAITLQIYTDLMEHTPEDLIDDVRSTFEPSEHTPEHTPSGSE